MILFECCKYDIIYTIVDMFYGNGFLKSKYHIEGETMWDMRCDEKSISSKSWQWHYASRGLGEITLLTSL